MTTAYGAPMRRAHRMPYGAEVRPEGGVRFRLWAPSHAEVGLELDGAAPRPMRCDAQGFHEIAIPEARAGALYRFVLPDGLAVPDPASRFQPAGVHGPSEVIDPAAHAWTDGAWRGRPWEEAMLYELHIGAFTPEGTFGAAIGRLDHLVALGVTAVSLMPVAAFPGRRNWGYDGVLPFAPDDSYGRPEDLKAFVEAAHARGLMVLLDVVHNHFGPDGNYLHAIASEAFTDRHHTPWGAAFDFAQPALRGFFLHNALHWIEEYHLDGLRLDAVHAILDDSTPHYIEELAQRIRAAHPGRHVHLLLENEANEARLLARDAAGCPALHTAQWNDDVHHVLHVATTGEGSGYYADYLGDTAKLARALAEGFAFQGEHMPYRGHPRGEPSAHLPPAAFVAFLQNHDQVGNRAFGDRIATLAPPQAMRAASAAWLLLPQVPMLFMGEEWGCAQPFPFFCDFGPDLADAVRDGRRAEFARFPEFADPAARARIPDPMAEDTFMAAKLRWQDATAAATAWHRRILAVRHAEIVPRLARIRRGGRFEVIAPGAVAIRWDAGEAAALALALNLSPQPVRGLPAEAGRILWREGEAGAGGAFGPWSLRWSFEEHRA